MMNGKESNLQSTVKLLIEQQNLTKAAAVHCRMDNVFNEEGRIVVISVYDNIKPSNEVLDTVFEYAEKNDEELASYISRLEGNV